MCHVGTLAGCDHVTISKTLNHMSTLTQSIQVVKSKAARVALDLQLAYSCKVTQLVAELDPEDLVYLLDSAKCGEVFEVVVLIVIYIFQLV